VPRVTYIEKSGIRHETDVAVGTSVMAGGAALRLRGIRAECGGACACGTCKVTVDEAWVAKIPPAQALEWSMLDEEVAEPNLRLSCQIKMTMALDGLVVRVVKEG
jgi:2Fe-2S ferredoxin